jgi:hypothetical protein
MMMMMMMMIRQRWEKQITITAGKTEGLDRLRRRRVDNIKMDLNEIRFGRGSLDSSGSAYGPV